MTIDDIKLMVANLIKMKYIKGLVINDTDILVLDKNINLSFLALWKLMREN